MSEIEQMVRTRLRGLRTAQGLSLDDLAERGLAPCLDVVPFGVASDYYLRTGWVEVGRTRPSWLGDDAPDVLAMILPAGS